MRHRHLMASAAAAVLMLAAGSVANAQATKPITIAPQALDTALSELGALSDRQVMVRADIASGKMTQGVVNAPSFEAALVVMLEGSGLNYRKTGSTYLIEEGAGPQSGSAAGDGAEVEALIVTAQKREEDIQDVPIAISAFTAEALEAQKIEGGFDLLKAIPNVTFSKNNFTSYNFSIRGIGTKAVSATTDPGVAVSFNNVALLQNRLFEQEYFDVERVEVLRGPQGTLYGRNATAGVINVISAKPDMNNFEGWMKGEVGNYHTKRLSAMVNVPLINDKLAIRLAGSMTDREGYDFNEGTGNAVNGRDLWSTRVTLQFNPTERIRSNLIWERFNEDDDRSRTGKQLCHRDPGPEVIGNTTVEQVPGGFVTGQYNQVRRAVFSQGCLPGSLYDEGAFGTPNGLSLPFVLASWIPVLYGAGDTATQMGLVDYTTDPYGGKRQSPDLRVIESIKDPRYTAKADIVGLNIDVDLSNDLMLSSQSVYNKDSTYSTQDYNRFNTVDIINDSSNWNPSLYQFLAPGGLFHDPQLGSSDKLVGYDMARAKGTQIGQEVRLVSNFDGAINFSAGANYTHFKTLVDYYVFYNLLTALAISPPFNFAGDQGLDPYTECLGGSLAGYITDPEACPYVDPNPLESVNGDGHNYFRSKNPYKLTSAAAFGELYWNITEMLKLTAGIRYTDDRKTFIPVPSQVLLSNSPVAGGEVGRGYPELPAIKQHWGEWSGRLGMDWKPELPFTDDTMLYAFYSRGYKGGGANPPQPGFSTQSVADFNPDFVNNTLPLLLTIFGRPDLIDYAVERFSGPILYLTGVEYGRTFEPEFVNALEVGAKNTLLGGALQANGNIFYYDYKDYQVSQIRDRTAVNENVDADVWGAELQAVFSPSRNFQVIGNFGYLGTTIGDGEESIDIMDRTAGNPNFVVVRSWAQMPSNCIVPLPVAEQWLQTHDGPDGFFQMCGGTATFLDVSNFITQVQGNALVTDPANINPETGLPNIYDPTFYNGQNGTVNTHGGAGITKNLSGNELPNAPHWTVNIGAQYGMDFLEDWRVTLRGDAYWQSQSWARVYNDNPYDKLHGWYNVNLSVWFEKPDADLKIELYAKNLLDKTPITDAFLNSDDTALTTNVFVLDPRLIGLSIKKGF